MGKRRAGSINLPSGVSRLMKSKGYNLSKGSGANIFTDVARGIVFNKKDATVAIKPGSKGWSLRLKSDKKTISSDDAQKLAQSMGFKNRFYWTDDELKEFIDKHIQG